MGEASQKKKIINDNENFDELQKFKWKLSLNCGLLLFSLLRRVNNGKVFGQTWDNFFIILECYQFSAKSFEKEANNWTFYIYFWNI